MCVGCGWWMGGWWVVDSLEDEAGSINVKCSLFYLLSVCSSHKMKWEMHEPGKTYSKQIEIIIIYVRCTWIPQAKLILNRIGARAGKLCRHNQLRIWFFMQRIFFCGNIIIFLFSSSFHWRRIASDFSHLDACVRVVTFTFGFQMYFICYNIIFYSLLFMRHVIFNCKTLTKSNNEIEFNFHSNKVNNIEHFLLVQHCLQAQYVYIRIYLEMWMPIQWKLRQTLFLLLIKNFVVRGHTNLAPIKINLSEYCCCCSHVPKLWARNAQLFSLTLNECNTILIRFAHD